MKQKIHLFGLLFTFLMASLVAHGRPTRTDYERESKLAQFSCKHQNVSIGNEPQYKVANANYGSQVMVMPVSSHPILSKNAGKVETAIRQPNCAQFKKEHKNHATESPTMYPVKIQVQNPSESQEVQYVCYFNAKSCNWVYPDEMGADMITVMLPEGKNDIVVNFTNKLIIEHKGDSPVWTSREDGYYIFEDVEIGPDTPMLIADFSECKAADLQLCISDGSEIEFPTMRFNGEQFETVSNGNVIEGSISSTFYNSKYEYGDCANTAGDLPFEVEGYENSGIKYWEIKVNPVSDNWVFSTSVTYLDSEYNEYNAAWLLTPGTEKVSFTKDDYQKLEWNFNMSDGTSLKGIGLDSDYSCYQDDGSRMALIHGNGFSKDSPVDIYMSNKDYRVNNTTTGWYFGITYEAYTDMVIDEEMGIANFYGVASPKYQINFNDGGDYIPSTTLLTRKAWENSEIGWLRYPEAYFGVPEFNYTQAEVGMKFNDSAPYMVTIIGYKSDRETGAIYRYSPEDEIYGLAGEIRYIDMNSEKWTATFNGEPIGEPNSSMDDFIYDWNPSENGEGILKAEVRVEPELIIDGLQAKNMTTLIVNNGSEDFSPPTVTCIQLRNNEKMVTNRFTNASDGYITLSVADVHPGIAWEYLESWDFWTSCSWEEARSGADLKVEVSPCGKNSWEELEAEGFGEFNPALGDFYKVDLGKLKTTSVNGWFDLRITVTDKTGNSQEQFLTPAFKVNNLTSVESFETEKDNNIVCYYNLQGMRVNVPENGQIYIVKRGNQVCKEIYRK